jgi:hypothetical protein
MLQWCGALQSGAGQSCAAGWVGNGGARAALALRCGCGSGCAHRLRIRVSRRASEGAVVRFHCAEQAGGKLLVAMDAGVSALWGRLSPAAGV